MASLTPSSLCGQVFLHSNSTDDTDSWQYVDTDSSPACYIPSPSSSLNGWGIIQLEQPEMGKSPRPFTTSLPRQPNTLDATMLDTENQFVPHLYNPQCEPQCTPDHELLFSDLFDSEMDTDLFRPNMPQDIMCDFSNLEGVDTTAEAVNLNIPLQFQDDGNAAPWVPMNLQNDFMFFVTEDVSAQMSRASSHPSARTGSCHSSPGMGMSMPFQKPRDTQDTDPIKKIRNGGRVEKKKKKNQPPVDNFVVVTLDTIQQQSAKRNPFECFEGERGIKPGRTGPLPFKDAESALNVRRMGACFCCRSRKVRCDEQRPCKNCMKISAQIPQVICWQFSDFVPVLFPSFIRGHFKREVIASFISDNVSTFYNSSSLTSLEAPYPIELSSGARFRSTLTLPASFFLPKHPEVLQHWHIDGHQLALHAALPVGIDPKDRSQREALKRCTREYIDDLVDEPDYPEQVTDAHRGTQLPRRILAIVQRFGQSSQSAMVRRALAIYVTHYVLTRQLSVTPATLTGLYHRHPRLKEELQGSPSLPVNAGAGPTCATTTRVLNRQVKAVLDEYLLIETQSLFAAFGAALKPRSRHEWGPCLASFLVLCLLFETIEAAADTFIVSEAEIALRTCGQGNTTTDENQGGGGGGFAVGARRRALDICREIDNLPFRQVAYRFHAVYQTHHVREPGLGNTTSGSSSNGHGNGKGAKGPVFNPLVDASLDADLEPAAAEMATSLRSVLDDNDGWRELDFLAADPILSQAEMHPYPRDITLDYTGRLVAKFLLSFTHEKYLFDEQAILSST
ncbi:hypothetical protein F4808DRAFT_208574 [Astrocystis sublimbata]|nr:hypothetical protein F4808DRAFT_208574 [Astrocystis sublimbata]